MNGGKEHEGGDREGHTLIAQVPIGWRREADSSRVVYISPSGSVLSCLEQVKTYLLTDGTCKCGLECPLVLPKVFNFDPGATVKQRTAEDAKADEDVTKLCIHKRKIIAVAALHRSMGSPHPSVALSCSGGGTGSTSVVATCSVTPQAIRNKLQEGQPNSVLADCKNPFKALIAGQRQYQQDLSVAQQHELYPGHQKQWLGSGEHGQRSPYRAGHGGLLSPASSGSLVYGDGPLSPRADPLGSPDALARSNFHGVGSPSPLHSHGRTALSPPTALRHSSPVPQLSCAMAGRTNVPLSPTVSAKSPVMKKPACSFPPNMDMPRTAFHHKPQPGPHPQHLPPLPPPCVLQKKPVTSEKDPLGILDPIPNKPVSQSPIVMNPSSFQPSVHSQVPVMNVNIPPAIVPLPSNLPLPTVKPGPVGHGGHPQRLQHAVATTSISPSPVTSPAHLSTSAIGRMEASPQRSRSSSTSSDHGSFIVPAGPQVPCSSMKPPPRSPRSSVGSPRPSMPSSPSTKSEALHPYKDLPSQLLGINNVLSTQPSSMFPPASAANVPQKGHAGLLGMPLNQILNQHNAASYPASSLLSLAAKAQLANQNKLTGNGSSVGSGIGDGSSGANGTSSALSSGGGPDGHSTLNSMFPPGPNALLSSGEGQSGRAALRDKLMAQQRDPLRKRKLPAGGHSDIVLGMLKSQIGGARPPGSPEQLRRPTRPGALPPSTSMAQLLQSMSCQSSHAAAGNGPGCMGPGPGGPCGPSQMHYVDGAVPSGPPQQHLTASQRLHSGDGLHRHCMDAAVVQDRAHGPHGPFTGLANQVLSSAPSTGCRPLGNPHPHHHQPQGYSHTRIRTTVPSMALSSNGGNCVQMEQGDTSSLNIRLTKSQLGRLQSLINHGQVVPQHGQPPFVQGLQDMQGFQASRSFPEEPFPEHPASNPMACLFQNFQVGLPESISVPNKRVSPQSGMPSLPEAVGLNSLQQLPDGTCEPQSSTLAPPTSIPGAEGLPGGRVDSVDAIYRAVVDAASRGMHVEITAAAGGTTQASPLPALSAMSAFATSAGEPVILPHAVSAVIHNQRAPQQDTDTQLQPPRGSRPRINSEQGKGTPESDHFRSPGRGTPRRQWEGEVGIPVVDGATQWRGEEFLECSTQVRSSSPCLERTPCPAELPQEHTAFLEESLRFSSCKQAAANFKERLEQTVERCAHMNGSAPHPTPARGYGDVLGPSRQELPMDDQSPGSSTSLEGPLAKDYGHYNGHYNGCAPSPSDTKSLSSEEDLRQPDSPSSSELLHYRPPRTFHMGDLVWGQIKGFPPWASKLVGKGQGLHSGMQNNQQGRVEPEKLKTLTEDLEALNRATKLNRK
ncbi:methyl-CpG-binding domain protein 5 isoform X2 [Scleropages formosus]|nr:methyl-CpG-binding domain protein 5-like isoform X2 [Scleropages formosus]